MTVGCGKSRNDELTTSTQDAVSRPEPLGNEHCGIHLPQCSRFLRVSTGGRVHRKVASNLAPSLAGHNTLQYRIGRRTAGLRHQAFLLPTVEVRVVDAKVLVANDIVGFKTKGLLDFGHGLLVLP